MDNNYWTGENVLDVFSAFLNKEETGFTSVFVLCDENTHNHCLPLLVNSGIRIARTIVTGTGERNKDFHTLTTIWSQLLQSGADRNTLLLNLGGGMITDLGGFAASTFMRGIRFVHMPTTLLGMVDASIGGKNGIDFGGAKNIAGTFVMPELVICHLPFLETLPEKEWRNGYAEMLKHELIGNGEGWQETAQFLGASTTPEIKRKYFQERIQLSAAVKHRIVNSDPFENGIRAALNFGHTVGHAIESWAMENRPEPISHGEAVAAGMIAEAFLSVKCCNFPEEELKQLVVAMDSIFQRLTFTREERGHILEKVRLDKKRLDGSTRFSLISAPGIPQINVSCTNEMIADSLHFYAS